MKGSFSMKKIFKVKDMEGIEVFFESARDAESFARTFCDTNRCTPIISLDVKDDEVMTYDEWRDIDNRVCDLSAFKDIYPKKWTDAKENLLKELFHKASSAKYILDEWKAPGYDIEDDDEDHPDYEDWFRETYCSQ